MPLTIWLYFGNTKIHYKRSLKTERRYIMKENAKQRVLCFKVPNTEDRQKVQGNINDKKLQSTYGSKSCRCKCSCTDGY